MIEQDLIQLLKNGDARAYHTLVDNWQSMIYNTALGIVQDAQEAEDVVQEVFIQVFRSIHAFRGDAKLSTWLYRIAITKALDMERRKKTKKRLMNIVAFMAGNGQEKEQATFYHPGVQLANKENAAILFKALQQLPDNQRICFLLLKTEGLNYGEVSAVMKVSVKAVESLMHRAKENLRKKLAGLMD